MALVPAVYVTIQDASFTLPGIDSRRSGFLVILSDHGPHNRVVEVNSISQFEKLFGKPNFELTGPGHYMAYKFLQFSSNLYVIRAALIDSVKKTNGVSHNAHLANAHIGFNDGTGFVGKVSDYYLFTNPEDYRITGQFNFQNENVNGSDTTVVYTDLAGYNEFEPGDTIVKFDDASNYNDDGNTITLKAVKVVSKQSGVDYKLILEKQYEGTPPDGTNSDVVKNLKRPLNGRIVITDESGFQRFGIGENILKYNDRDISYPLDPSMYDGPFRYNVAEKITGKDVNNTTGEYEIELDGVYMGTSTNDFDPSNDPDESNAGKYHRSLELVYSDEEQVIETRLAFHNEDTGKFNNIDDRRKVELYPIDDFDGFVSVNIGDWIVPSGDDVSKARQVIEKEAIDVDDDPNVESYEYYLILDDVYTGNQTTDTSIERYIPLFLSNEVDRTEYPYVDNTNLLVDNPVSDTGINRLFNFYAMGVGSWYNNIFVKADRNVEMEKMLTDENGEPLYKYAFVDVRIYREKEDGGIVQLEGPWTASLIRKDIDNNVIRNIFTGEELYIETVVNRRSDFVIIYDEGEVDEILLKHERAETNRLQVLSMLTETNVYGTNVVNSSRYYQDLQNKLGFYLGMGEDGVQYDKNKKLRLNNLEIEGILTQAYKGTLKSTDSTIELIVQDIYPWYVFDYIICGGYSANIQNGARQLADTRYDAFVLADNGYSLTPDEDIDNRLNLYGWNTWNAMLYTQYRKVFDEYNGRYIVMSPVYQAIENHLHVDKQYWIAEPVAGIEKGAISEPMTLIYKPTFNKMADLIEKELNPTIVEPDGIYFLTQLTTWKRLSVMKRAHVVKFVQYVKKTIPGVLKDILQRKATGFWIGLAQKRVNGFMNQFVEGNATMKYVAITSFSANVTFDEARSELNITLNITPIRAIEAINVNIFVY